VCAAGTYSTAVGANTHHDQAVPSLTHNGQTRPRPHRPPRRSTPSSRQARPSPASAACTGPALRHQLSHETRVTRRESRGSSHETQVTKPLLPAAAPSRTCSRSVAARSPAPAMPTVTVSHGQSRSVKSRSVTVGRSVTFSHVQSVTAVVHTGGATRAGTRAGTRASTRAGILRRTDAADEEVHPGQHPSRLRVAGPRRHLQPGPPRPCLPSPCPGQERRCPSDARRSAHETARVPAATRGVSTSKDTELEKLKKRLQFVMSARVPAATREVTP
jgi:hypothetical protein